MDLDPHAQTPKTTRQSADRVEPDLEARLSVSALSGDYDYEELSKLLVLINQHVWFGHFDLVRQKPVLEKSNRQAPKETGQEAARIALSKPSEALDIYEIVFRLTLPLGGMEPGSTQHFAFMVHAVTETVERFLPAFELWQFDSLPASEAFAACLFETQGEA